MKKKSSVIIHDHKINFMNKMKTNTVVDMASAAEVKEFSARCQQLTNHPV